MLQDCPDLEIHKENRSSTTAIDRTCDVVFPETTSFPLKERLALHGARDWTLSAPRVADDDVGWNVAELSDREMEDLGPQAYAWKDSRPVFAKSNGLQDVLMTHLDVEHSDRTLGSIEESGASFEAASPDLKEQNVFEIASRHETRAVMKGAPPAGWRIDKFARGSVERSVSVPPWARRSPICEPESWVMMPKKVRNVKRTEWKRNDPVEYGKQQPRSEFWVDVKAARTVARMMAVRGRGE